MVNNRRGADLSQEERVLITQFLLANSKDGVVNNEKVKEAASSFGVSRRTIQYTWKAAKQQMLDGVPALFKSKKKGLGGVPALLNVEAMKLVPFSKRSTIRKLAKELNASKSSVGRWIKKGEILPHTNAIHPVITQVNMLKRLKYSLHSLEYDRYSNQIKFQTMHNVIHIDEKWFYMSKSSERFYILPGEVEPYRACKSKRYIVKVMFMCAVARPLYSIEGELIFNGKIGIFPFTKSVPAQRNSKNRVRGTMETQPIDSITKDVTRICLVHQIIPAIKEKWPECASKDIFIQQDNAKPHISDSDPQFREAASSDGFNIKLVCQPANSPDTNVNDIGFFRAIQSLKDDRPSKNVDELVQNVKLAFEELDDIALNNVFLSLQSNLTEIIKVKGHNNFKQQHMGKEALIREGRLPLTLEVDELLVREGIDHLVEHNQIEGAEYEIDTLMTDLGYV